MENRYIKEFEKSFGDYDYLQKAVNMNCGSFKTYASSHKPINGYNYKCTCKKDYFDDRGKYTFNITITENQVDCFIVNLVLDNAVYTKYSPGATFGSILDDEENKYNGGMIVVRIMTNLAGKLGYDNIENYAHRNKFYFTPTYKYGIILQKGFERNKNADYYIDMTMRVCDKLIDIIDKGVNISKSANTIPEMEY